MKTALRQRAIELRLGENLSYGEIRKRINVSKSTLSYWLRDYPLSEKRILELRRRGWEKGEASRERFRNTMRKKKEERMRKVYVWQRRRIKNISKDAIFVAGLMLYLGEGSKTDPYSISLANTDVRIIKFFIQWLENFLSIPKKKIRVGLHLYENMDIAKEGRFWERELGFTRSQFYKPQIRKLQASSFSYRESFRHGTCSIYVNGVKEKTELMMGVRAFLDEYMQK